MTVAFYCAFLNSHRIGVLTTWLLHGSMCHVKLLPSRGTFFVHHATMHQFTVSLYAKPHNRSVRVYLAVAYHLRFWQNDWNLLHAIAVTRGWNGYRNNNQHRKLTPEKKPIPPILSGLEPTTFRSRVRRSTAVPSSLPLCVCVIPFKRLFVD